MVTRSGTGRWAAGERMLRGPGDGALSRARDLRGTHGSRLPAPHIQRPPWHLTPSAGVPHTKSPTAPRDDAG
jgi:hypothetical protein